MLYPEHNLLASVKLKSQAIGEFLEWLTEQGLTICKMEHHFGHSEFIPHRYRIEQLLAEHFEIDLDRLEDEKQAMWEELQR